MIYLYVNGVKRKFLLDSGSAITIIKENTLDNLEIHNVGDILLAGITGEGLQAIGMVKLNFGTQPNVVNCVFNVIVCGNNLVVGASGIIGRDFLGLTNSIINYKNNTLQIWNELIPISYEREDIFANIYNYNQGLSTNKEKIGVNYELVEKESVTSKKEKGISYELANKFPLYPSTQERSTNTQDINTEEDYDNEIFYDALQDMPQKQSENVYDSTLFEDRYLKLGTKENQTNGTKIKEFFNKSSQETTSRICHRKNIHGIGEIKETENLNSAHSAKLQYDSGNIPTIKEKTRKAAPDWTAKVEIIQYGELSEEEEDFHSAFKQRQQNFIINKANNEREKLHNNIQSSQLQVRNEITKETNFCVDTSLAKPAKLLQDENDSKLEHTSTEQNSKKHFSNDRITENNVIKLADEIIIPAWCEIDCAAINKNFDKLLGEFIEVQPDKTGNNGVFAAHLIHKNTELITVRLINVNNYEVLLRKNCHIANAQPVYKIIENKDRKAVRKVCTIEPTNTDWIDKYFDFRLLDMHTIGLLHELISRYSDIFSEGEIKSEEHPIATPLWDRDTIKEQQQIDNFCKTILNQLQDQNEDNFGFYQDCEGLLYKSEDKKDILKLFTPDTTEQEESTDEANNPLNNWDVDKVDDVEESNDAVTQQDVTLTILQGLEQQRAINQQERQPLKEPRNWKLNISRNTRRLIKENTENLGDLQNLGSVEQDGVRASSRLRLRSNK
ncbi:hypothetical protein RN001_004175 [Aquatica leii]|uniref:Peptidase A2 domain-containing protein n=1 Tax=Aquatica leii TaxID=1421715 RepID=A0AAN7PE37_9COLE|nr:hypothetical protein RN001_004175 [Aquatica leii]